MRRRDFIAGIAGSAAWPLAAGAQRPALPVIGYLGASSRENDAPTLASMREGLKESGFVEDQNVTIDYRWADGLYDRLPALAADLVRRPVDIIFAPSSTPAALAAKAATASIPIVFTAGSDPVAVGLVASLSRPGGNVTGVSILVNLLSAKRLELFHTLLPKAGMVAALINPNSPNVWPDLEETQAAAKGRGLQLIVLNASTAVEIETAFARLVEQRAAAVFVLADGFFRSRPGHLIGLAARHALPASYPWPEFVPAGGLMGYGANAADSWRQAGVYIGRILKGERPADLPVMQSTKIPFALNLKTAKALGLDIPPMLLALADEVIE